MDWTALRAEFPVTARWAFFDHAAVAPIPDTAVAALAEYGRRIAENGLADVRFWADRVAEVFAGLVDVAAGLLGGSFAVAGRDQQERGQEDE